MVAEKRLKSLKKKFNNDPELETTLKGLPKIIRANLITLSLTLF